MGFNYALGNHHHSVLLFFFPSCAVGILYGTMTLELGGKITIECEKTKCAAELEFKLKVLPLI